MGSDSEAGSYLRLIDFVYHSTLGLRVIKKKEKLPWNPFVFITRICIVHGLYGRRLYGRQYRRDIRRFLWIG